MNIAHSENDNQLNNVIVLGAAGFIGKNLSLRLISDGHNVKCFDKAGCNMDILSAPNSVICYGEFNDFADANKAKSYLEGVDTVYHLISTTCPTNSNLNIAEEFNNNVLATISLLDACVANHVKKVVFLSSGGTVYGKNHEGILSEEDEASPISSYGIQKLTIEKLLYLYFEMYGLDYRVVRLSNPYGPYQRPNGVQGVVSTFTWRAMHNEQISVYGDGSVIRDYIFIDDAIEGIVNIASDNAKHKLYNLGSGIGLSVNQVIATIKEVLKKDIDIEYSNGRKVDVPVNILNTSRYVSDFGQLKLIDIREGIYRLAEFYVNHEA